MTVIDIFSNRTWWIMFIGDSLWSDSMSKPRSRNNNGIVQFIFYMGVCNVKPAAFHYLLFGFQNKSHHHWDCCNVEDQNTLNVHMYGSAWNSLINAITQRNMLGRRLCISLVSIRFCDCNVKAEVAQYWWFCSSEAFSWDFAMQTCGFSFFAVPPPLNLLQCWRPK